jgi:hypothetical protein
MCPKYNVPSDHPVVPPGTSVFAAKKSSIADG